jgi:hypothetical protein
MGTCHKPVHLVHVIPLAITASVALPFPACLRDAMASIGLDAETVEIPGRHVQPQRLERDPA